MERLTTKRRDGRWAIRNDDGATPKEQINKIPRAIDRLAAYEDTMTLERAQDLAQAKKDGRLVVLPCKVGDTVYVTYGEGYITCVVDRMHIIANNQVQVRMRNFIIETLWLSVSEFGETVFLTRQEAEAALKKREEAE